MNRCLPVCLALALLLLLAGCGGSGGSRSSTGSSSASTQLSVANVSCSNNPAYDSTLSGSTLTVNTARDYSSPVAHTINTRMDAGGAWVTVSYMLDTVSSPKGMLVLFSGGDGTTGISPTTGAVLSTGNNFLVRSSDLYAYPGNYDVVVIDRPSDAPATVNGSWDYDVYRTSMNAAVDISAVINDVNTIDTNTAGLPVLFAGTSRGAISAASNSMLSSGIDLSSPVTSGSGSPVGATGSPSTVQAAGIKVPVQVTWNSSDGCSVSSPAGSLSLGQQFFNAGVTTTATAIEGGLGDYTSVCNAKTYHGYLGVESCTVGQELAWADSIVASLTAGGNSRPVAIRVTSSATGAPVSIDLNGYPYDNDGDTLSYAIPYATSSLGGSLSLNGSVVTYTPPVSVTGTDDSFVYVVSDGKGGTASNIVSVSLN